MSSLPKLTDVFARLASRIEIRSSETEFDDQSDDVLVAALNQLLNLSEVPRVRVLDTALSLMCYTSPQVFESLIDCSVNTIVSVLSSSVDCKVLRSGKLEVLRVGGSISGHDCLAVMESCADVLGKVNDNGLLSSSLLYAALRVAVMTTRFGLILWYLDPQNLVKDVSKILQDAVERPFICLNEELYENIEWRSIIICLAISPLMFIETRALMHRWFLLTGLASVLEFGVELVSVVLDVLLRPMWWGLSAEIGSKLPFSYAYFLHNHQLFRILARPLSCDRFLELVHNIKKTISHSKRKLKHVATTTSMVDHKSAWAMAMNFPEWFYFAALLLCGASFSDSSICGVNEDNKLLISSFSANASWYIAWILDPIDESVCDLLAQKLVNLSSTLNNKHLSSYEHKKLKKPKPNTCQIQSIRLWMEELEDVKTIDIKNNMMFRRIILGMLIGCSDAIDEDGYELLLHYVATGKLFRSTQSQYAGLKLKRPNHEFIDKCSQKELVTGACIVFNLTDIAERISDSVSETPVDFICKVKLKVIGYLLKCVKRLLQFDIDENSDILIKDLHRRMLRWRHQAKDIFHGYKDLDDTINVIASKFS